MSNDKYDGEKLDKFIGDEIGQMPLMFKMNGSEFRWEAFKMAYEMTFPKSIDRVKLAAQEIIDWVNDDKK